jgi:predicted DNA-binding transcriptional regulator AlpA
MLLPGLSKTLIYGRMKDGRLPRSIHLGSSRTTGWIEAKIDRWIGEHIRRARSDTAIEQADGVLRANQIRT